MYRAFFGIGMTNYVSLDILANDPAGTPHMTYATNLLGNAGRIWMGIITILAAASTINTVYASVSRIVQGMGEEGMMPSVFAKTNKRGAAWVGLVVLFVFVAGNNRFRTWGNRGCKFPVIVRFMLLVINILPCTCNSAYTQEEKS